MGDAVVLKTKGDALYKAGRFTAALEYYTWALDKAENEKNNNIYYACIGNIGNIYSSIGDYNKGLHYYKLGYKGSSRNKDTDLMFKFVTNIIAGYCMVGDVKSAKEFFTLQMNIPHSDKALKRYYSLYNQGIIAQAEGNISMAGYYHRQALAFAQERGFEWMHIYGQYSELGNIALKRKNHNMALAYYNKCDSLARKAGNKDMMSKANRLIYNTYRAMGNSDSAAHYKNIFKALDDSVYDRNQFFIANNKLFEYENKINKQNIDRLVSRNTTQLVVIVIFLILIAALTYLYIALRRKNKDLIETQVTLIGNNEELDKINRKNKDLLQQYVNVVNKTNMDDNNGNGSNGGNLTPATAAHKADNAAADRRNDPMLNEIQINRLLNSINNVMNNVDVISRSDFSLNMLAQMVDSNTKYVSWVINYSYGKSFRIFLNEYRIREACKRLADQEHYGNLTLQAIYENLGYNSAASFIQAFKKENGMTPSTYQKLIRTNKTAGSKNMEEADMEDNQG